MNNKNLDSLGRLCKLIVALGLMNSTGAGLYASKLSAAEQTELLNVLELNLIDRPQFVAAPTSGGNHLRLTNPAPKDEQDPIIS